MFLKVVTETPDRFLSGNGRQLKGLGPLVVKLLSMRFAVFATVALEGMTMHFRPCLLVSVEIELQLLGTSPSNVFHVYITRYRSLLLSSE